MTHHGHGRSSEPFTWLDQLRDAKGDMRVFDNGRCYYSLHYVPYSLVVEVYVDMSTVLRTALRTALRSAALRSAALRSAALRPLY